MLGLTNLPTSGNVDFELEEVGNVGDVGECGDAL